jgi:hypothetical protein
MLAGRILVLVVCNPTRPQDELMQVWADRLAAVNLGFVDNRW